MLSRKSWSGGSCIVCLTVAELAFTAMSDQSPDIYSTIEVSPGVNEASGMCSALSCNLR